jgi:hypothetical protein
MSNFGDWFQNNWYQVGSFFVQIGLLFAAVWFAKRILKTLRASQEQVGALLKLSVSDASAERQTEAPAQSRPQEASPYWLEPTPAPPVQRFVTSRDNPVHSASSGPGFLGWLKSPMRVTSGTSSFHRVLRWLQSPASN